MYGVEIVNKGGSEFTVTSKGYEFTVDTKGRGVTPPDALLASLGTCVGVYLRKYCEGAKLPIGGFRVVVEAELTQEAPVCFREIKVAVELKGVALDDRRKAAILDFIRNCPVHATLKASPKVEVVLSHD